MSIVSFVAFLTALIIFIVLAIATVADPTKWAYIGFAAISTGLLFETAGPAASRFSR